MKANKITGGFVFPAKAMRCQILEDVEFDDVEIVLKDAAFAGAVK
ncbi:MAG: hypothetical protein V1678_05495 [Candidatus Aenigmatarchaeota archaeon]